MTMYPIVAHEAKDSGRRRKKGYGDSERASARDNFALRGRERRDETTTDTETPPALEVERRSAGESMMGAPLWIRLRMLTTLPSR